MLQRLTVENYALIEHLELTLDARLNIITGETGAGKSILLGALGLLLGNKNESTTLKDPSRNCIVEGIFDIAALHLEPFFAENDLEYDAQSVVRRVITPAGKSRAYVNDLPVPLTTLRELGGRLIDIHSQHRNLILSSEAFRTRAIDTLAGNERLLTKYRKHFDALQTLRRQLAQLRDEAAANHRDEEWLRFRCEELTAANLRAGEQAELEAEQSVLADADAINAALTSARNAFDEDEIGILARLKGIESELGRLRSYPRAAELTGRLQSVEAELKDINATLAEDAERIEANPERLQRLDDRLGALFALCQKYRTEGVEELIALRDQSQEQLQAITHSDERIAALEAEIAATENDARLLAAELHAARAQAAPGFCRQLTELLGRLGMPDTRFEVTLGDGGELTPTGCDRVEFLFSANRDLAPQAVDRIASGGELSRVMLSLKALLARRMELPTIIFDEIDTGVSGRIADAMGEIISTLARSMQVIDITHLPQVASKGDTHFVVYKRDGRTSIARLDAAERVTEIAKMLSGSEITEAAREQAEILLGRR